MFRRAVKQLFKPPESSAAYWDHRFASDLVGWVAGGDRRFSQNVNQISAMQMMAKLADVLKRFAPARGKTLLDAGCGVGHFAESARQFGFDVCGVDFSATAVERARERFPAVRFEVADLTKLNLGRRFDAIICLNVLVAVADARRWRAALGGLSEHLADAGEIVILEKLRDGEYAAVAAPHVAFRSLADYREAFTESGLTLQHHQRMHFEVEDVWKDIVVAGRTHSAPAVVPA